MDIGNRMNNSVYYQGYEGERQVIITTDECIYHIWDGYFEDIFGNPVICENGWMGFTRDYNECVNTYDECVDCAILVSEYLADLQLYLRREFEYPETNEVLQLLISIMKKAQNTGENVTAHVD